VSKDNFSSGKRYAIPRFINEPNLDSYILCECFRAWTVIISLEYGDLLTLFQAGDLEKIGKDHTQVYLTIRNGIDLQAGPSFTSPQQRG
jgi:hypothetical protein